MSSSASSIASFLLIILLSMVSAAPLLSSLAKDPKTNQYTATVYVRTPPRPKTLVLDLGFFFSWVDCENGYGFSFVPIFCNSSLCASLNSIACSKCFSRSKPACANDSCAVFPENPFTRRRAMASGIIDSLALPQTDGYNPGPLSILPRFFHSCSPTFLLKGLAKGSSGVLALGRSNFSLPAQVSTALSLPNVFALCLSGSPSAPGVAFYGTRGPYYFLPGTDASLSLTYTPLLLSSSGDPDMMILGQPSHEYFINVTSIKVNGKPVRVNSTPPAVDNQGFGGCKISTVTTYTVMETSIFQSFAAAFIEEAAPMNLTVVKRVKPFGACFSTEGIPSAKAGPVVPTIDLVLKGENVYWRIYGANSMVVVKDNVMCLAFVDGGKNTRTSIIIGGYQMEDNLLQFDLEKETIGFSSSLLLRETTCSNFNFTSNF
ncbi:probable aspartic proteinase GIP2 [Aristolochia californica]|uniref:probable aspartic proteinase GIP2 n=1 Tax=Aristolochia californica TaxID=171875 RepID=UPI0035D60624